MGPILEALHSLQDIEQQLAVIRREADARRRQVRVHQRSLEKQDELFQNKNKEIQNGQMEIDRIVLDVRSMDDTLNKHREALNRAKTNKEYAAILTTINTEKADNTKLETRQLELMSGLDALRAASLDILAEREKISERVARAEEQLRDYLAKSADQVRKLEQRRESAATVVAPGTLSIFRRVAEKHEGEAMARIVLLNAKRHEYTCGGCNISMTLQQVIGCKSADDLVLCGSCGRILYFDSAPPA